MAKGKNTGVLILAAGAAAVMMMGGKKKKRGTPDLSKAVTVELCNSATGARLLDKYFSINQYPSFLVGLPPDILAMFSISDPSAVTIEQGREVALAFLRACGEATGGATDPVITEDEIKQAKDEIETSGYTQEQYEADKAACHNPNWGDKLKDKVAACARMRAYEIAHEIETSG